MLVKYELKDYIAQITIDRPEALNALNRDVLGELAAAVDKVKKAGDEVRVVLIKGGGEKSFVAGADIGYMVDIGVEDAYDYSKLGQDLFLEIERLHCPTIAVVQGFALGGGCELALACDIRIASAKARFGLPETGLGIFPGYGGTQRLARLVGLGQAKKMIFSADMIKADQALAIGLVEEVTEPEVLLETALKLAQTIASRAPHAVSRAKESIDKGYGTPIETGLQVELGLVTLCFASSERTEGMKAFVEKRTPNF